MVNLLVLANVFGITPLKELGFIITCLLENSSTAQMALQSSHSTHNATAAGAAQFTWRGFAVCFMIALGMLAAGYPSALIGTTLGEPSFLIYMGLYTKGATGSFTPTTESTQLIGAMNGVFQAGAVFGSLGAPWIIDRWGRRAGFVYASSFSILGGAILTSSNGVAMFIVARFLVGLGAWTFVAVTPVIYSRSCTTEAPRTLCWIEWRFRHARIRSW